MDPTVNSPAHIGIPERHGDAQLCLLNYSKQAAKQTHTIELKKAQKMKHQVYFVYKSKISAKEDKNTAQNNFHPKCNRKTYNYKKNLELEK